MEWRFLNTGAASGAFHMALDEALVEEGGRGALPLLRLYSWSTPCLSLGYFQAAKKAFQPSWFASGEVELVRRPTGGKAVLHHREVTYSLIAPADHPLLAGGVLESYKKIAEPLVEGLRLLEVDARIEGARKGGAGGFLCFQASTPGEITVGGRKLAGSAQCRRGGLLLQQGSILLDLDQALFQRTFGNSPGLDLTHAISVKEALGREVPWEEAASAIKRGFEKIWGVTFREGKLTEEERELAEKLLPKYKSWEWNWRR